MADSDDSDRYGKKDKDKKKAKKSGKDKRHSGSEDFRNEAATNGIGTQQADIRTL